MGLAIKGGMGLVALGAMAFGGVYFYAQYQLKSVLTNFEHQIETAMPGVDFGYGEYHFDLFEQTAYVESFSLRDEKQTMLNTGALFIQNALSPQKSGSLERISFDFNRPETGAFQGHMADIQIKDLDVESLNRFSAFLTQQPENWGRALAQLNFNMFKLNGLTLTETAIHTDHILDVPYFNFAIGNVRQGKIGDLSLSGDIVLNSRKNAERQLIFAADKLYLENWDIPAMTSAFYDFNKKQDTSALNKIVQENFGLTKIDAKNLSIKDKGATKNAFAVESIEYDGEGKLIKDLDIKNIFFEVNKENHPDPAANGLYAFTLGQARMKNFILHPKIVDLLLLASTDIQQLSSAWYEQADTISLTGLEVSIPQMQGERFSIKHIESYDIEVTDYIATQGKFKLEGLRLPLKGFADNFSKTYQSVTGSDAIQIDMNGAIDIDLDIDKFDLEILTDVAGIGALESVFSLINFPIEKLQKLGLIKDEYERGQQALLLLQEAAFNRVKLAYSDKKLAKFLLQDTRAATQYEAVAQMSIAAFAAQYPSEQQALAQALSNFFAGKEHFSIDLTAHEPVKFSELSDLFIIGELRDKVDAEFSGR